jgi:hypothetical protein
LLRLREKTRRQLFCILDHTRSSKWSTFSFH